MHKLIAILLLLSASTVHAEQLSDLAPEWRQYNWTSPGSCGHASTVSALRWVEEFQKADKWRHTYSHGENFDRHLSRLKKNGLHAIWTNDGSSALLDYAARTRRMAIVYWPSNHITNFVGYDSKGRVVILDNNHTDRLDHFNRKEWFSEFRSCGGCAIVILDGMAPPPVPLD